MSSPFCSALSNRVRATTEPSSPELRSCCCVGCRGACAAPCSCAVRASLKPDGLRCPWLYTTVCNLLLFYDPLKVPTVRTAPRAPLHLLLAPSWLPSARRQRLPVLNAVRVSHFSEVQYSRQSQAPPTDTWYTIYPHLIHYLACSSTTIPTSNVVVC